MQRWLAAIGGSLVATLIVVACAEHAPQSPTPVAQSGGGDETGLVRAQETPEPPVFPSTLPTPQTYPTTLPAPETFPTTLPAPQTFPTMLPAPQTYPTTASPQPTPQPTATPSPSPPGSPRCPQTVTIDSTDTPQPGGPPHVSSILPLLANFTGDCTISSVEVRLWATATNLADTTSAGRMVARVTWRGERQTAGTDLINLRTTTNRPLTGTQIGKDCDRDPSIFKEGSPDFAGTSPPYNGDHRPAAGNFNALEGRHVDNSSWTLTFSDLNGRLTIRCWTLKLALRRTALAPEQEDDSFVP